MIHKRHLLLVPGRSSVPVSSYACLWIANYETGHTLPSSSSWEVARHWERAGGEKKGRGEITSNSSTRILRHWVKKQLLWSSISQERGGLGCGSAEGHRTTLAELWVCEDDMGDERICYFAERDANVMLVMCLSLLGDSRQVRLSLLWACSDYSSGRGLLRNCFLKEQLFRSTRAQQTESVFWDTGHSMPKSCSFIFTFVFLFFSMTSLHLSKASFYHI